MATINTENPITTASPGKNVITKPTPLGDATNMDMKDKVVRTHTKFDDEGEVTETTVTEIEETVDTPSEEVAEEATEQEAEEAAEEAEGEAAVAAQGDAEEEAAEDGDAEARMAYRSVPSLFNTEKERAAKWEGKHTRFPEDDEGEEDGLTVPVSEEMQAQIDDLSSAVSTSMVVETSK